jgi:hypothetical protein
MTIQIDELTIQELQENPSARNCVEAFFTCAAKLAKAIGVDVTWQINSVTDDNVDRSTIHTEFGKLSAIVGVLAAGAHFNPIQFVKEQNDATKANRAEAGYFSSRQKNDPQGKGRKGESSPEENAGS